ncbi:MAG: uracil-DNA glycosylase [Gammaproteobacteria bacterium]|nr:uracil-DNA glycosylase [Gammaproteobacteria bacterium]
MSGAGNRQADRARLQASWKAALADTFEQPFMGALRSFLATEKSQGKVIYPPGPEIFAALDATPLPAVRVVIIGQDPYHGPNQAHGLCFSVRPGVRPPPSLENIFKEVVSDMSDPGVPGGRVDAPRPANGSLLGWARQGVLLLNAVLTVERGRAGAHQNRGWEQFTDRVVELVNAEREHVVFMLWGSYAQKKGQRVDRRRHEVLTAPHPSPLSAHRGFFGCRHFSRANRYLVAHGQPPIDWLATD